MVAGQDCRLCQRLVDFRSGLSNRYPSYHNSPVNAFGPDDARLLIVGLAPGLHGANKTGRPFTGDASGDLLFETLHHFGFASHKSSRESDDGIQLTDCRITNAVKCVPPENRPTAIEVNICNQFLREEIEKSQALAVILALGKVAHEAVSLAFGQPKSSYRFAHDTEHILTRGLTLVDSYHCSRYMINTGRLTKEKFNQVFVRIRQLL